MKLTDLKELKMLLERHGYQPKKMFGQHFLCSEKVVSEICNEAINAKGILEVGPGPGVLTQTLLKTCEKLTAVEIDRNAVQALKESAPTALVIEGDVLETDLKSLIQKLPEPRMIVSNMPYQITAPLLAAFAELKEYYIASVLMMQKEVGDKILAQPGDSKFGSISIFLQSQFTIKKVIDAKKGAFFPPPKVESIVLKFIPKETGLKPESEQFFFQLIRLAFKQPRQTLVNNISKGLTISKEATLEALQSLDINKHTRPHQIDIETWKKISEKFYVDSKPNH